MGKEDVDKIRHRLNAMTDSRHNHTSRIHKPQDGESITFTRCTSCMRLVSPYEIRHYGCCPRCRGGKITGAFPSWFEQVIIFIANLTRHWFVWGPESWWGHPRVPSRKELNALKEADENELRNHE